MYSGGGRDQKRSQQAFGKGSRKLRLGLEAARIGCRKRMRLAPVAKCFLKLEESENVRISTQLVPSRGIRERAD